MKRWCVIFVRCNGEEEIVSHHATRFAAEQAAVAEFGHAHATRAWVLVEEREVVHETNMVRAKAK